MANCSRCAERRRRPGPITINQGLGLWVPLSYCLATVQSRSHTHLAAMRSKVSAYGYLILPAWASATNPHHPSADCIYITCTLLTSAGETATTVSISHVSRPPHLLLPSNRYILYSLDADSALGEKLRRKDARIY